MKIDTHKWLQSNLTESIIRVALGISLLMVIPAQVVAADAGSAAGAK